jgi:CheY-like chemotaxis protein
MVSKLKIEVVPLVEVPKTNIDVLPGKQRPAVLVVDDERIIANTLSVILTKSGFLTMAAYDGASALELAESFRPDLLISDVVMPEMTGIELAITLTQRLPNCKVLLFSGQAATVDLLEKARKTGHDFTTLTKPVHPTEMLRHISECLATGEEFPELATKSPAGDNVYQ